MVLISLFCQHFRRRNWWRGSFTTKSYWGFLDICLYTSLQGRSSLFCRCLFNKVLRNLHLLSEVFLNVSV